MNSRGPWPPSLLALITGAAHAAFLYAVFKIGLLDSRSPPWMAIALWIAAPSLLAGYLYWRIAKGFPGLESKPFICFGYAVACLFSSTYLGMFLALDPSLRW